MKWSHLPVDGGIYKQHPDLMDRFYYILAERSKHEAAKAREEENKSKSNLGTSRPSTSRRGRRS